MNSIRVHDQGAQNYDRQTVEYECYAHDVLFGMGFEYVRSGERLLDLGIGTGLASLPFAKAGLEVSGLDGSAEMLNVCRAKGFAQSLQCHDLLDVPLPYADQSFDHGIACGVFHFFGDLAPIIKEASRIIRHHGIFAFTVLAPPKENEAACDNAPDYLKMETAWGLPIFAHRPMSVAGILKEGGFEIRKRQKFLIGSDSQNVAAQIHTAFVAQK